MLLFLNGCSGSQPTPSAQLSAKKELPSWYLNPPKDTITSIYGVAVGENRDDAIKLALTDMISKLGIKIESAYESTTKEEYGYAST